MANPNLDTSFTRSLYIGHDKTAEVQKRKEAAEKELQAKREARIREQNERIARAAQQKEAELRDRGRQKQQKELERQKAVLDRRCAQLERMKSKKTELLARTHQHASRMAEMNQQKKRVYVFGSSTPRELTYLENIKHQQRNNTRGSSPSLAQSTSQSAASSTTGRMASRFQVSKGAVAPFSSSAMTRSVHGLDGGGPQQTHQSRMAVTKITITPTRQAKKPTPNTIKRQRKAFMDSGTCGITLKTGKMTQSLYAQGSSRMESTPAERVQQTAKPAPKGQQLQANKPFSSRPATPGTKKLATVHQNNKVAERPVIRPRKMQQKVEEHHPKEKVEEVLTIDQPIDAVNKNDAAISEAKDQVNDTIGGDNFIMQEKEKTPREEIKPIEPEEEVVNQLSKAATAQVEIKQEEDVGSENGLQKQLPQQSLVEPTVKQEQNESIVVADESTLITLEDSTWVAPLDDEPNLLKADMQQIGELQNLFAFDEPKLDENLNGKVENDNHFATTLADDMNFGINENADNSKVQSFIEPIDGNVQHHQQLLKTPTPKDEEEQLMMPNSPSPKSSAAIILPDAEEREARRRRVNEILQLTRQAEPAGINGGGNGTTNGTPSANTSSSNPLVAAPQKDASTLAQDILAKHRHKFQQPKQQQQQAESGSSRGSSPSQQQHQKSTSPKLPPTSLANELAESGFFTDPFANGNNAMMANFYSAPGEVIDLPDHHKPYLPPSMTYISTSDQQHPTPPGDKSITNGHEFNGSKEFHPPEPTSSKDIVEFN